MELVHAIVLLLLPIMLKKIIVIVHEHTAHTSYIEEVNPPPPSQLYWEGRY